MSDLHAIAKYSVPGSPIGNDKSVQRVDLKTYRYSGCDFRLTGVAGKVIHDIIA